MGEFLEVSREKWREVPAGGDTAGRTFSSDLIGLSDDALLEQWRRMDRSGSDPNHRGWYQTMYHHALAGRRVVEVGSGLGFDGIYFLRAGARWVFADIVKDNLAVVRRAVDLMGLSAGAEYLWIDTPASLEALEEDVDVVWANGSLHHAPFELAREESQILLRKLKPNGRWIELFYPYERWVRQGKLPFSEWGKFTDGERTPWAEWHDAERIKQRLFPAATTTILDYRFGGGQYGWLDLRVDRPALPDLSPADVKNGPRAASILGGATEDRSGELKRQGSRLAFKCTGKMWNYAATVGLNKIEQKLNIPAQAGFKWAVDLEVSLAGGAVGFVLTGGNVDDFLSREVVLDARPASQRLTLTTDGPEFPSFLLLRNAAFDSASEGTLDSGVLRSAT
jgi:SAM-dependent methyltransferase